MKRRDLFRLQSIEALQIIASVTEADLAIKRGHPNRLSDQVALGIRTRRDDDNALLQFPVTREALMRLSAHDTANNIQLDFAYLKPIIAQEYGMARRAYHRTRSGKSLLGGRELVHQDETDVVFPAGEVDGAEPARKRCGGFPAVGSSA